MTKLYNEINKVMDKVGRSYMSKAMGVVGLGKLKKKYKNEFVKNIRKNKNWTKIINMLSEISNSWRYGEPKSKKKLEAYDYIRKAKGVDYLYKKGLTVKEILKAEIRMYDAIVEIAKNRKKEVEKSLNTEKLIDDKTGEDLFNRNTERTFMTLLDTVNDKIKSEVMYKMIERDYSALRYILM